MVTTQQLQMIRGSVDLRSFQSWAGSRQMMSRQTFDEGYAMHCFLAGVFGELAPQPFRLIIPSSKGNRKGVFYGYGRADIGGVARRGRAVCRSRSRPVCCPFRAWMASRCRRRGRRVRGWDSRFSPALRCAARAEAGIRAERSMPSSGKRSAIQPKAMPRSREEGLCGLVVGAV